MKYLLVFRDVWGFTGAVSAPRAIHAVDSPGTMLTGWYLQAGLRVP